MLGGDVALVGDHLPGAVGIAPNILDPGLGVDRSAELAGRTIGLLDIGKARGDVFIRRLGERLGEHGLAVRHYAKPTNTKVAPAALAQAIASECDLVVEALSD